MFKKIEGVPEIPVRGFMLDISRCRVPTQERLLALVEVLAKLNYNQFQLYTEHTFAFKDHEEVWKNASPMTPEQVKELDARCKELGIELVPNLNSFGHVQRWLVHEPYRHMAELPEKWVEFQGKLQIPCGTFTPSEETADFMGALYKEFLPNFTSDKFNIGGDEPYELGKGQSADEVWKKGLIGVYTEHMLRLKKRANELGKRIMFWGDVLQKTDQMPKELTDGSIPILWGYEKGHPWGRLCSCVEGTEFYLAPGTSGWNSFGTRMTNAVANIREAVDAARKFKAQGVLVTEWGDNGNANTLTISLLPLIYAGAAMSGCQVPQTWQDYAEVIRKLDLKLDNVDIFAEALYSFEKLDDLFKRHCFNASPIYAAVLDSSDFAFLCKPEEADQLIKECQRIELLLKGLKTPSDWEQELMIAHELFYTIVQLAAAQRKGDKETSDRLLAEFTGPIKERYKQVWHLASRDGGLDESLSYIWPEAEN